MTTDDLPEAGDLRGGGRERTKHVGRWLATGARVLMGLAFFVFGLDGFLHFIPQPQDGIPERAAAFGAALMQTGYMMPLIKATELIVGALLLVNRFVPLALALIAPVIVNIFAFNAFLAPPGLPIAFVIVLLELYLVWTHREAYRPMLAMRSPRA